MMDIMLMGLPEQHHECNTMYLSELQYTMAGIVIACGKMQGDVNRLIDFWAVYW